MDARDQLAGAVRAYLDAQEAVAAAEQGVLDAKAQVPIRRSQLADAIVAAAKAGMRQRDIVAATGYTRENVRLILRAGGVEAG